MFRVSTTTRRSRRSLTALVLVCMAMGAATTGPALAADAYPAKIGDTPAEFGRTAKVHAPKIGDTPADFGKPVVTPSLVEIVRPERTIVRDTDPALPIVLSGVALLVALGLALRTAMQGHGLRTRAH